MYNLVNLSVKPSGFIQAVMYGLLTVVLAVSVFYLYSQPLFLIPLICVQAFYFWRLKHHQYVYQRPRQWQIKNGQVFQLDCDIDVADENTNYARGLNDTKVKIDNLQVWHSLVLFSYQRDAKKHHEIISMDAVDQEAFRQFRCMIKRLA